MNPAKIPKICLGWFLGNEIKKQERKVHFSSAWCWGGGVGSVIGSLAATAKVSSSTGGRARMSWKEHKRQDFTHFGSFNSGSYYALKEGIITMTRNSFPVMPLSSSWWSTSHLQYRRELIPARIRRWPVLFRTLDFSPESQQAECGV